MGFDNFKEVFENQYGEGIYNFIEEEGKTPPFKFELVEDLDEESYNSYGYEDTDLRRIFFIPEYDIYVEFWGNRSSFQGEDWYGYKEVFKTEKIISVWEQKK